MTYQNESGTEDNNDFLKVLVNRNWDQVKYIKSIVTWFAEIYMGLIAGVIAISIPNYGRDSLNEIYIYMYLYFS
jgi:hypothetical protein